MKVKQIVDEHKKGVRAKKYTKKTVNPSVAHAKAKEKLQPVGPVEETAIPWSERFGGRRIRDAVYLRAGADRISEARQGLLAGY